MAPNSSNPTFKKVKRDIEALIRQKSEVLRVGRSTLVYRIRDHYGWPGTANALTHKVLSNKVHSGHLVLLDRDGQQITRVSHGSLKNAAGCRVLEPLPSIKAEPPKPLPRPTETSQIVVTPVTEEPIVAAGILPLPMPEPVLPTRAAPKSPELLDMIVLDLWLTPEAEVRDETNAITALARRLSVPADARFKRAVRLGLETDRLDAWPRRGAPKLIMVREIPGSATVEALRQRFPFIAAGRTWPPLLTE